MTRIPCPHCGVPFRLPDQARRSAPCPACQKAVEIPEDTVRDAILLDGPGGRKRYLYEDDEDDRPRRRLRRRRRRPAPPADTLGDVAGDLVPVGRLLFGLALIGIGVVGSLVAVYSFYANLHRAWAGGLALGPLCCYHGYKTLRGE